MDIPCPFSPAPADIMTYTVPERFREKIVRLWKKREGLNTFIVNKKNDAYARESQTAAYAIVWRCEMGPIVEEFESIEEELRQLVEASRRSCVEYYADWKFRCPDHYTLHAEYLARCDKKK
jgi:hypothetical protein